jgi:hypothetical protein
MLKVAPMVLNRFQNSCTAAPAGWLMLADQILTVELSRLQEGFSLARFSGCGARQIAHGHVRLSRASRDHHRLSNAGIGGSGSHQLQHFRFTECQGKRVRAATSLLDDRRVERRSSIGDPMERRNEFLDLANPFFQLADSFSRIGEQLHCQPTSTYWERTSTPHRDVADGSSGRLAFLRRCEWAQSDIDDDRIGRELGYPCQ